jgi:hypothetical protein
MTDTDQRARAGELPNAEQHPMMLLWPEAGRALGLTRAVTYSAASRGEIPVVKVGRRLYVPTGVLRRKLGLDAGGGDAA